MDFHFFFSVHHLQLLHLLLEVVVLLAKGLDLGAAIEAAIALDFYDFL